MLQTSNACWSIDCAAGPVKTCIALVAEEITPSTEIRQDYHKALDYEVSLNYGQELGEEADSFWKR